VSASVDAVPAGLDDVLAEIEAGAAARDDEANPGFPDGPIGLLERAGLLVCDIEILRLHYAETLKAWRERFMARREEAIQLYDERFARMWEFYLASSEMAFRKQNLMNLQIQLTKRQGIVPMTRDYIAREEQRLRAVEGRTVTPLRLAGE